MPQGERDTAVADVMSRAFGYRIVAPAGDLSATSASGAPEVGATRSRVEEQWQGLGNGVVGAADARIGAGGTATAASASDAVRADYDQNAADVAEHAEFGAATASARREAVQPRFDDLANDRNLGTDAFEGVKYMGAITERAADAIGEGIGTARDAASRGIHSAEKAIDGILDDAKKLLEDTSK